jgi:repressor LexA
MLTPRQAQLLRFIETYQAEHGYSPCYEEMIAALGLKSKLNSFRLVRQLEERGLIRRLPNRARAVEIIRPSVMAPKLWLVMNAEQINGEEARRRRA